MRAVIDTNILIDFLSGEDAASEELTRHDEPCISPISWMEVMVGAENFDEERRLRAFLAQFERVPIDDEVAEIAVGIRKTTRIRLPDAIIWATARRIGGVLVTRNTRDFPQGDPGVRVPYSTTPAS